MPKLLIESEVDPVAEQVDRDMMEVGEATELAQHKFDPNKRYDDLSDGGSVGDVRVIPVGKSGRVIFDEKRREPGRPSARAAWTWDGRPTTLPLAWDRAGKQHDGARKYLMKRHCSQCKFSGFYGRSCPSCKKAGRPQKPGGILPAYYLRESDVPNPTQPFGAVDCFVQECVRRDEFGFKSNRQMRQHAMTKHRIEYRAFMDDEAASKTSEIEGLKAQLDVVMKAQLNDASPVKREVSEARRKVYKEALERARAAKKAKKAAAAL